MATGETTTGSLSDALPVIKADARIVNEYEGTYMRTCDMKRQKEGTGLEWQEFALSQMAAQDITETTQNENAQQYQGTLLQLEPDMTQILVKVTDRTYRKIAPVVKGKMGTLAGNAMARKKDEDYLSLFSTMTTGVEPATGNPLSFGHISAAVNRIQSNVTEPSMAEVYAILHGYQIYDIQNEVVAGVGTYTIPAGLTAETFRKGFKGTCADANVFVDGNISINATPDANGAVHSRDGVVAVAGMTIKTEKRRDPSFGGGADELFMTDEYGFVIRQAVWCYRQLSDATAPTA